MYKVAVIGERDTVAGFMALGFTVREAATPAAAAAGLHELAACGEYAVIFVTETLAAAIEEDMERYKDKPLPAVISIPSQGGSSGYGRAAVKSAVERAVGADIIFKE